MDTGDRPQDPFNLDVAYWGKRGSLFWLAARSLFLTLITLGIYRFWMRTKLRRYYWSAVAPGDEPLEYTGTGLEKLLGFLIAVVFLAIYLGIVNLGLSFVGLAFFQGNPFALNLSLIAAIPLIYYARYRARRYILSRTKWRGLRFGAEQAAGRYMLAALWHTFLSVITLGILYPRQNFKLEQFVTDRTWYGDMKFHQGGSWGLLMRHWAPVILIVLLMVLVTIAATVGEAGDDAALFMPFLVLIFGIFLVHYNIASFRVLAAHKTVGENVGFESKIRTGRIVGIYVLGVLGVVLGTLLAFAAIGFAGYIFGIGESQFGGGSASFQLDPELGDIKISEIVFLIAAFFLLQLAVSAMIHVAITQPLLRHYAEELTILNAGEIEHAAQRPHDQNVEAEGFADALDVGAAI